MVFKNRSNIVNSGNNYIYKIKVKPDKMPNFNLHDVTSQMEIMYGKPVQYTKNKLCAKREKLRLNPIQTSYNLA